MPRALEQMPQRAVVKQQCIATSGAKMTRNIEKPLFRTAKFGCVGNQQNAPGPCRGCGIVVRVVPLSQIRIRCRRRWREAYIAAHNAASR